MIIKKLFKLWFMFKIACLLEFLAHKLLALEEKVAIRMNKNE